MSVKPAVDDEVSCTTETREAPAHFLIKIESFPLLKKCGIDKYETKTFAAGGYNWRLIIYPNGDNIVGKKGDYVSAYLAIADTSSLPENWEVNALFTIFLLNQISGNYLTSVGVRRSFARMKSEWGISKFISKTVMSEPSNGYLVDDKCVFGAEVLVIKRDAVTECLYLKNVDIPYKRDWKISNFSKLEDVWESEEFSAGCHKWKISLHPKGDGEETDSYVSVFLHYLGSERVQALFTISIKNQITGENEKETDTKWFSGTNWFSSENAWGWGSFIETETMNDPNKGFLVKDSCLLAIELYVKAVAN